MDPNDPGTEAEALDAIWEGAEEDECTEGAGLPRRPNMSMFRSVLTPADGAAERTRLYEHAKAAKVGSTIACPQCGKMHVKTTYHKVFCSNGKINKSHNCKDKFWNFATEERRARTQHYSGR